MTIVGILAFVTASIAGTWIPVEVEVGGQKLSPESFADSRLELTETTYKVVNRSGTDIGKVRLDTTVTPHALDITGTDGPNAGKTIFAIYEVTDDTLRVCYALDGGRRPLQFRSLEGSGLSLIRYRRAR